MLWLIIDRNTKTPIFRQVCEQIRTKILKRELRPGERLPATRKLAQEFNISRNVVSYAYEQLLAEGYLESREGSGTYVAGGAYLEQYQEYYREKSQSDLMTANDRHQTTDVIDFESGVPDLTHLPRKIWAKLLRDVCLDAPELHFNYGDPLGEFELRTALSEYVLKTKGIHCKPEQVVILPGSAKGFSIIAHILDVLNREIIIEDPVYLGIQHIFQNLNIAFYPVPVDEKGMQTDLILPDKKVCFLIVTPSHQYPLGSVLPIQRRIQLVDYAGKTDTFIIENDYDSEFRYSGPPIHSLHLLDPNYVVHIGTFSQSLFPSVRLGYMILPERLIHKCRAVMKSEGISVSALKQLALARFIAEGHLDRHFERMKKIYREKREVLITGLQQAFSDRITIRGDSTGLYVVVEFHHVNFTTKMLENFIQKGVRIYSVEEHAIMKGRHRNKVILGYGNLSKDEIESGIKKLSLVLKRV